MKPIISKIPLSLLYICAMLIFVSCNEDDKQDCGKSLSKFQNAYEDYWDSYLSGQCADLDILYNKTVKAVNQGIRCSNVQEQLLNGSYNNAEEFISDFEKQHELNREDCGE